MRTQIAPCLSTWIVGTRVAALAMGPDRRLTGNPFAPTKALRGGETSCIWLVSLAHDEPRAPDDTAVVSRSPGAEPRPRKPVISPAREAEALPEREPAPVHRVPGAHGPAAEDLPPVSPHFGRCSSSRSGPATSEGWEARSRPRSTVERRMRSSRRARGRAHPSPSRSYETNSPAARRATALTEKRKTPPERGFSWSG